MQYVHFFLYMYRFKVSSALKEFAAKKQVIFHTFPDKSGPSDNLNGTFYIV